MPSSTSFDGRMDDSEIAKFFRRCCTVRQRYRLRAYCGRSLLIVGALTWASYADHRRDKHKQSAKR